MRPLARLRLVRVRVPLLRPLTSAHGSELERDVILAAWGDGRTGDDGVEGWGECPTLSDFGYAEEITGTAWRFLCDHVGPALATTGGLPRVEGAPMAMGAVRDAHLDLRLRRAGTSLAVHLGGAPGPVPSRRVIGVEEEVPVGVSRLKVKVTPATVDRLRLIRADAPSLDLAADANGSFDGPDDLPDWLDAVGLRYLEQPFGPDRLAEHAEWRRRSTTPVALDESVTSDRHLAMALEAGAMDLLSLKPARLGGVDAAEEARRTCVAAGVGTFVGGMLETGVGRATALGLAAVADRTIGTDLGPSHRYFAEDLTEPVEGDAEMVVVPDGPGCGRRPDPARLAAVTVDEARFTAP